MMLVTDHSAHPSAAWHGTRVILRQVSAESLDIFDFILELYASCSGDWRKPLACGISSQELSSFVDYAATFLSNVGNYYVQCFEAE